MAESRRRKKDKKRGPRATPGYMTTFGDMMNLLLTFFILLLTTATIQGREFKLILSAFSGSFGMMSGGMTLSKGKLALDASNESIYYYNSGATGSVVKAVMLGATYNIYYNIEVI